MSSARGRMHGERPEAYRQRRAFESERRAATQEHERRREAGSLPVVLLDRACECRAYSFAHFHSEGGRPRARA